MNCDNCDEPKNSLTAAVTGTNIDNLLRCQDFVILNRHTFTGHYVPYEKVQDVLGWQAIHQPHGYDGFQGGQYHLHGQVLQPS